MSAFGERVFTFGERAFTFGERAFTFGDNRGFRVFWNFFFCCWEVFGLRGSGGPVGVFENRCGAELPPFISIVRYPGLPVILGMERTQ